MFALLLSNLPFSPSLIVQVSFYAKRLKQEAAIRRLGFIMIGLGMLVQMFAVLYPAEPTLAASNNDILRGGFSSKQAAVDKCKLNEAGFATILRHFGVSCEALAASSKRNIRSTDYDKQLYSLGRVPYGKPGEISINIAKAGTFYMRPLWVWDRAGHTNYSALSGTRADGTPFMILYNCGDITVVGTPAQPTAPPAATPPATTPPPPTTPQTPPATVPATPALEPCPYDAALPLASPDCKPCDNSQDKSDTTTCLILTKTASNDTQNITKADGTTAKAGDVITYTLSVENTGQADVINFVVEENISDILEYATTTDLHGGTVGDDKIVRWPATDVSAGQTVTKQLTVTIKNPIPQTPVSASNPASHDLTMTNVYGNAVNITLPPSVAKTTEQITRTLPSTGPGTSLMISFGLAGFTGYFFCRSRLMAKELDLVRRDYAASGGA
jgi:uncharacterized repeat protein (TIGR01451 family)